MGRGEVMKVSEAKTKVCPFMEVFIYDGSVVFETGELKNSYCVCGDCMAWVWTDNREVDRSIGLNHGEGYCKRLANDNT